MKIKQYLAIGFIILFLMSSLFLINLDTHLDTNNHDILDNSIRLSIETDKNEYNYNESVTITITSNYSLKLKLILPYYTIEKYSDGYWNEIRQELLWPCEEGYLLGIQAPYLELDSLESVNFTWNLFEHWCDWNVSKSEHAGSGTYRIKCEINFTNASRGNLLVYSENFTINGDDVIFRVFGDGYSQPETVAFKNVSLPLNESEIIVIIKKVVKQNIPDYILPMETKYGWSISYGKCDPIGGEGVTKIEINLNLMKIHIEHFACY